MTLYDLGLRNLLETDFYLASTEHIDFEEPRCCHAIRRVQIGEVDDCLLIEVDRPIPGRKQIFKGIDLHKLILQPRHEGASLFPVTEWPVFVHVVVPLGANPETKDEFEMKKVYHLAWGELYRTRDDASNKLL